MKVIVLQPEEMRAAMRRLAGITEADEVRDALCSAELQIARSLRALTDPVSNLYGSTFWMVSSAEWLTAAEETKARCEAQLDAMGEPHRTYRQEQTLRQFGLLPRLGMGEAVSRAVATAAGGRA